MYHHVSTHAWNMAVLMDERTKIQRLHCTNTAIDLMVKGHHLQMAELLLGGICSFAIWIIFWGFLKCGYLCSLYIIYSFLGFSIVNHHFEVSPIVETPWNPYMAQPGSDHVEICEAARATPGFGVSWTCGKAGEYRSEPTRSHLKSKAKASRYAGEGCKYVQIHQEVHTWKM